MSKANQELKRSAYCRTSCHLNFHNEAGSTAVGEHFFIGIRISLLINHEINKSYDTSKGDNMAKVCNEREVII